MVNGKCRREYIGVVAVLAGVGGIDMVTGFTDGLSAVVATGTGAGNTVVIKAGGYPCPCSVTVVALRSGLYMV